MNEIQVKEAFNRCKDKLKLAPINYHAHVEADMDMNLIKNVLEHYFLFREQEQKFLEAQLASSLNNKKEENK